MNKKRTLKLGDGSGLVSLFLILSLILTSVSSSLAAAPPEAHVPETIDSSPATLLNQPVCPVLCGSRITLAMGRVTTWFNSRVPLPPPTWMR